MKPVIYLNSVNTVLLDMDGTLLDLYFDNYFWQEYMPEHWAKLKGMEPVEAKSRLMEWYKKEAGTLAWYCLDFWSERLDLDVLKLKEDVEHLINIRPYAEKFLEGLSKSGCEVIMVTNAHEKLVQMKMEKTGIDVFFDHIVSSHAIGHAKEEQAFWEKLHQGFSFEPESTVLIDDNLTVLRAARDFGIGQLLTIAKPDSNDDEQDPQEFQAIHSFEDVVIQD